MCKYNMYNFDLSPNVVVHCIDIYSRAPYIRNHGILSQIAEVSLSQKCCLTSVAKNWRYFDQFFKRICPR